MEDNRIYIFFDRFRVRILYLIIEGESIVFIDPNSFLALSSTRLARVVEDLDGFRMYV